MMIEYQKMIYRRDLLSNPQKLFVFGDNMLRRGFGGQAKEMRGEPNAVGIPTKRQPSMNPTAFFIDDDFSRWWSAVQPEFERLLTHEGVVVWPEDGIGTGLARLEENAPRIFRSLTAFKEELSAKEATL